MQRGHIYKGKHSGWYSISDEAFYTEPQVCTKVDEKTGKEVKVSIETGSVVEWTEEENYKFSLSSFKSQLRDHFLAHPDGRRIPRLVTNIEPVQSSDISCYLAIYPPPQ